MSENTETEDVSVEQLYCWKDKDRVCGPDCVAYDAAGSTRTSCLLLNEQLLIRTKLGIIADKVSR